MEQAYVVTEKPFNGDLLMRLLPADVRAEVGTRSGLVRADAASIARSIASGRLCPVLLVMNARGVDEDLVLEECDLLREVTGPGLPNAPVDILMAVPEMEIVLFHEPCELERVLGVAMTVEERVEARFQPGVVLDRLIARSPAVHSRDELLERVDDGLVSAAARHPLVREAKRFLAESIPLPALADAAD